VILKEGKGIVDIIYIIISIINEFKGNYGKVKKSGSGPVNQGSNPCPSAIIISKAYAFYAPSIFHH
jgi:hypothetical protein